MTGQVRWVPVLDHRLYKERPVLLGRVGVLGQTKSEAADRRVNKRNPAELFGLPHQTVQLSDDSRRKPFRDRRCPVPSVEFGEPAPDDLCDGILRVQQHLGEPVNVLEGVELEERGKVDPIQQVAFRKRRVMDGEVLERTIGTRAGDGQPSVGSVGGGSSVVGQRQERAEVSLGNLKQVLGALAFRQEGMMRELRIQTEHIVRGELV